jgi:hypothetical protein
MKQSILETQMTINRITPYTCTPRREFYALDPESWAVLERHGLLMAGIGRLFRAIFEPGPSDAVAVGVDRRRVFAAAEEFPSSLLRVGDGPSGGELALMATLDCHHLARRFDGLTIGSGDGAFVPLLRAAQRAGLRVRVVSWAARLSGELGRLADEVVLLDNFLAHPGAISARPCTLRGNDSPTTDDFTEAA